MNLLYIFLQAQGASAPAGQGAGGGATFWIMIILMFAVMWLFMIRPQRKQQKELENFRRSLQKGDKVVTAGGIYGTIQEIEERTVLIKVDGDVKLRVDKIPFKRIIPMLQQLSSLLLRNPPRKASLKPRKRKVLDFSGCGTGRSL